MGKLSPKVTDEGAIDLPNGAGEKFRWGDWREPLRLSTRKGWVQGRPHPPQCAHWGTYGLWWLRLEPDRTVPGLFDPQGEGFGGDEPDLETFFHKKMLSNIFSLENASQIGLGIPEETAPLSYQRQRSPKRASESERAMTPGVQGACPRLLFLPIFGRNGDPCRAGAPWALRPEAGKSPDHPKGTQYRLPPGPGPTCGPPPRPEPTGTYSIVIKVIPMKNNAPRSLLERLEAHHQAGLPLLHMPGHKENTALAPTWPS